MNNANSLIFSNWLVMSQRLACRVCHVTGLRGIDAYVMPLEDALPHSHPQARIQRVRAARRHYAAEHPEITLPT